jgi:hypothetical protein
MPRAKRGFLYLPERGLKWALASDRRAGFGKFARKKFECRPLQKPTEILSSLAYLSIRKEFNRCFRSSQVETEFAV